MSDHEFLEFLSNAGHRRYRKLIQHHVKRSSAGSLAVGTLGEMLDLPEEVASFADAFLEALAEDLGRDPGFWRWATCQRAFVKIINTAIHVFPDGHFMESPKAALKLENCDLSFQLFQMATTYFAYMAMEEESTAKVMGIRSRRIRVAG